MVRSSDKEPNDNISEIKNYGDTVYIRQVPDVNIHDYGAGQELAVQHPEESVVTLSIDQGHYFNFLVEDVMAAQADMKFMNDWSDDASMQMKIKIDGVVLNGIYSDVDASNAGNSAGVISSSYALGASGAPVAVDSTNVLERITALEATLNEANVPEAGRWYVATVWLTRQIQLSELKEVSVSGDGESMLRNGRIGRVGDFTVYKSNNYTSVTDGSDTCWHTLAGHPKGLAFAAQFTKLETLRSEKTFGDLVRGLNVYGYKVIKGECLAELYCKAG